MGGSKHSKRLLQAAQKISEREEIIEKKIKAIEVHLLDYGDQIRKSPSDALKAHALLLLKQKRRYEVQKSLLCKQRSKIEHIVAASERLKKEQKSIFERMGCLMPWNMCRSTSTDAT